MVHYVIAPPFCTYCRCPLQTQEALCAACMQLIQPMVTTFIYLTKTAKHGLPVHAVGRYHGPLQKLIVAKKYSDALACYYMGQLMCERIMIASLQIDYLVPIPLHWRRYAKRGYNQSEQMAYAISKQTGIPVLHALKRVAYTPFQSQLKKNEREKNVENAFVLIAHKELEGKRIAFVDDVMTTGATLTAAAQALQKASPKHMQAIVLART